jgi:hypothetical protein
MMSERKAWPGCEGHSRQGRPFIYRGDKTQLWWVDISMFIGDQYAFFSWSEALEYALHGWIDDVPRQVFATGWEQQSGIDECAHDWWPQAYREHDDTIAFEDKCEKCGCPRCPLPGCVDRRHHRGLHIFEDGHFEPLGGILEPEL